MNVNYICHSGGAEGADTVFELTCEEYEIKTITYSFPTHKSTSKNLKILTRQELVEGFQHIQIAAKSLNRNTLSSSPYVCALLARNWFQVKNSEAVFAIGEFEPKKMGIFSRVKGGTGWAVQMAIDNNKEVYIFEQNENKWFYFYKALDGLNKFIPCTNIPKLTLNFAGIGTRKINDNGIQAIIDLCKFNFET